MSPTFKVLCSIASTATLVALFSITGARSAEAEGPRRGPPPEAIAACEDLEQGDACSVTHDERTLEGTCEETPDGALACRPEGGRGHRSPPPEAIEACSGSAEGAACSVTFGEHTVEGTCELSDGEQLACRPS